MSLPSMPQSSPEASGGPGQSGQFADGASDPLDMARPLYGASFGQAFKRFFGRYATFSGRSSRSEYWWVQLFMYLISLLPGILVSVGTGIGLSYRDSHKDVLDWGGQTQTTYSAGILDSPVAMPFILIGGILGAIWALAIIIPSLSLIWRRLHDANLPGPLFFLVFVPGVGGIIVLVLTLLPSKPEGRRFDRQV